MPCPMPHPSQPNGHVFVQKTIPAELARQQLLGLGWGCISKTYSLLLPHGLLTLSAFIIPLKNTHFLLFVLRSLHAGWESCVIGNRARFTPCIHNNFQVSVIFRRPTSRDTCLIPCCLIRPVQHLLHPKNNRKEFGAYNANFGPFGNCLPTWISGKRFQSSPRVPVNIYLILALWGGMVCFPSRGWLCLLQYLLTRNKRLRGSTCHGARAVRAQCGYGVCSIDPFIQSQSGGMVTPHSQPGTIYNSSSSRPSPGGVVQIPDAVRARCGYSP